MTEKRFTLNYIDEQDISANIYDDGTFIGSICIGEKLIVELLNCLSEKNEELKKENEQLKKQLNDVTFNWTQNHLEFDKNKLYVKDHNIEITLKEQNLFIQVFIPEIKEYFRLNYIVTGKRLEKEYQHFKGDKE